jgi:SagB-type dehydrogenase family enzyme
MALPLRMILREGVRLVEPGDGRLVLRTPKGEITAGSDGPGLGAGLRRLAGSGATEEELVRTTLEEAGPAALPTLLYLLKELKQRCLLSYRVAGEQGLLLATATPVSPFLAFAARAVDAQCSYVLSRFAYLRREQDHMVVESPLLAVPVTLHDARVGSLCWQLTTPRAPGSLAASCGGLSADEVAALCLLFLSCGILVEVDERGQASAEGNGALSSWEFHDLLFHTRTRIGRHQGGYGGTFRFLGRSEPLPATKPAMSEDAIDLYRPDLEHLRRVDVPLTSALEDRRSRRRFGDPPITLQQLGEFLYRTARQRKVFAKDRGELSNRPYPNGGSVYELEVYLSIRSCRDLPEGFYHYCPREHRLYRLPSRPETVNALLREGASVLQQKELPQVLLTIAARFSRVAWKYESIAYALILKNLGVLYQTMYLVAESMGLAACALGGGNADLFAAAAGVDYYAESSVGELVLGSRPAIDASEDPNPIEAPG